MTDPRLPEHDPAADTSVTPVPTTTHVAGSVPPAEPVSTASTDAGIAPATVPVATDAVVPPPVASAKPRNRGRWIAAIAVVALVVGASAAIALALTASSGQSTVVGYVPADSTGYVEVRLDLPGDQRAELAEFLSKFPGFADQAALETKLDEVLDELLQQATDGQQTFSTDIKPWFDGEIAVALGDPATAETRKDGPGLALISIKDEALANAWLDGVLADVGATPTTETYGDTQLRVWTEPTTGATSAFAIVDGKVAIAGDDVAVKAAIDTNGSSGFVDQADVKAAMAALEGDHVGFGFVDMKSLLESTQDMLGEGMAETVVSEAMLALIPDWSAFQLRVEGDALIMSGVTPAVDGAPGPDQGHANGVADWAPPSTLLLAAGNDAGATIDETIDLYRADPALKDALDMFEQSAGILGGVDGLIGWMGDTGVVVTADGEMPAGGLVSVPTDAAQAQQLFTTLRSFVALAGGQAGFTVTDEDHGGTTVTTIDLGSLSSLAGLAGEALPVTPDAIPTDAKVTISYAATDEVVVIGTSADFVKAVLDAGPGPSLADDARYQAAVGRVGAEHTGVAYVDIAGARTLIESHLDEATAGERAEYEESIKPFLTPFDVFAAANTVGGDVNESNAIITVK